MWDSTFNLIVLFIVVKVGTVVLMRFIKGYSLTDTVNRLNFGLVSRKDLTEISDSHFINWCLTLMEQMNFTSVDLVSASLNDDIQLCSYEGRKKIYLKCIKCHHINNSKDEDDFEKVGKPELQKLVGRMEHDYIYNAWIITNGDFTSDALEFVQTLPEYYNITLIDGCSLTQLHRRHEKQYVTS